MRFALPVHLTAAVLLGALAVGAATAQPADTLPERGDALVAATRTFAFYSDPLTNLHDFLVRNARSEEALEPESDCQAELPAEERQALERAGERYEVFATPDGNRLLLALRYRLAGFGDLGLAEAAAVAAALEALQTALPAYERCWWATHDARNRRWVTAVEPLLAAYEDSLSERLSELYGADLARPFPVDVVSYGGATGADSVVNPDHLLISSTESANTGYAALEILFHEASHTVFGPRLEGRLWTELEAVADGTPLPRDFWHAMLFYTTGASVEARLAEQGIDYDQYLYTQGLFDRAWRGFRGPLERFWQPYVDGRVSMTEALEQIVEAPMLPDRGEAFVAASRAFVFYSDSVTNLHDFLVVNARSQGPVEPKPECLAELLPVQREAFARAREHYTETFADGAGERILLSMRWRLANLGETALADPAQIAATMTELISAAPAYESCWWPEHDARNRRWVASLLPLLDANEDALRTRLAELYDQPLARWLPVDVVGYAGIDGGSPVLNPHQLLISSVQLSTPAYALETLFREASQTIFGQRAPGGLWRALQAASSSAERPMQQDFLRLLLLFTTGKTVQARLAEQSIADYEPYLYRENLLAQALPAHRDALEQVWQGYLDGRVPMAEAVEQVVEALPAEAQ